MSTTVPMVWYYSSDSVGFNVYVCVCVLLYGTKATVALVSI